MSVISLSSCWPISEMRYSTVFTSNGRVWISLSMIDADLAEPGTRVNVVWGEPDGGTTKPTVERHVQTEVRATVAECPFSRDAREAYRPHELKL